MTFLFLCHGANLVLLISMAEQGRVEEYKTSILYTYIFFILRLLSVLRKKIDLKGKFLQGLFSEKN